MRLAIIIFIAFTLSCSSNQNSKIDPDDYHTVILEQIKVTYPKKWKAEYTFNDKQIVFACFDTVARNKDIFSENFHIRFYPNVEKSIDLILIQNLNSLKKELPNGKFSEIELEGAKSEVHVLKVEVNKVGLEICSLAAFYLNNDDLYVLNFIYELKNHDEYYPIFTYVAQNIQFK